MFFVFLLKNFNKILEDVFVLFVFLFVIYYIKYVDFEDYIYIENNLLFLIRICFNI